MSETWEETDAVVSHLRFGCLCLCTCLVRAPASRVPPSCSVAPPADLVLVGKLGCGRSAVPPALAHELRDGGSLLGERGVGAWAFERARSL